jgi:hypothetical protein
MRIGGENQDPDSNLKLMVANKYTYRPVLDLRLALASLLNV